MEPSCPTKIQSVKAILCSSSGSQDSGVAGLQQSFLPLMSFAEFPHFLQAPMSFSVAATSNQAPGQETLASLSSVPACETAEACQPSLFIDPQMPKLLSASPTSLYLFPWPRAGLLIPLFLKLIGVY